MSAVNETQPTIFYKIQVYEHFRLFYKNCVSILKMHLNFLVEIFEIFWYDCWDYFAQNCAHFKGISSFFVKNFRHIFFCSQWFVFVFIKSKAKQSRLKNLYCELINQQLLYSRRIIELPNIRALVIHNL